MLEKFARYPLKLRSNPGWACISSCRRCRKLVIPRINSCHNIGVSEKITSIEASSGESLGHIEHR